MILVLLQSVTTTTGPTSSSGGATSPSRLALTAIISIIVSTVSAWLIFRFVKRAELDAILENRVKELELVTKPQMAEELWNQLQQHRQRLQLEERKDREDRVRKEILRWANPIRAAVQDLAGRLKNILTKDGYLALDPKWNPKRNPNWPISYDYFMNSSLYLFAIYFAHISLLKEKLSFELFSTQQEKKRLFDAIENVADSLAGFPYDPIEGCSGRDAQVFRLQQRSLGELMICARSGGDSSSESPALSTYPKFLERLREADFTDHFDPLRKLLQGVRPGNDCRWRRLEQTYQTLRELDAVCEELLDLRRVKAAQT